MANRQPRQTRGRQRIPIQRIENQDDMYATFSKRRLGLYKKASELSTLCGVDVGIIIFSPTGNPFSFFHPSMESVIERYRNPNQPLSDYARLVEAHTRARIEQQNQRLDEIHEEEDQLKEREKQLDEVEKTRVKGWWQQPVENMTKEQMKETKAFFQDFSSKVRSRIEELRNGATSSASSAAAPPPGVAPAPFQDPYYNVPPPEQFYVPDMGAGQDLSGAGGSGSGQYPIQQYGYGYFPDPIPGVGPSSSGQYPIQYDYMAPPPQGDGHQAGPSHDQGNFDQ